MPDPRDESGADLIERLRELTMREVSRDGYCREEPVPLNRDGPEAADELTALRSQVSELRADLEVAVGALEPFSQAADDIDERTRGDSNMWEHPASMNVTASDFRDARAAITSLLETK